MIEQMDDADRAQVEQDIILKAQLTHRADDKYSRDGKCHWCDDDVTDDQVFCDGECADAMALHLKRQ